MLDSLFHGLLDRIARRIVELASELKARVLSFVLRKKKKATREEIRAELQTFDDPYLEELGDAIGHVTGRRLTVEEMRRFVVGEVTLSHLLYHQADRTAATVARLLREHVKYEHDARKLALDIFTGYGRKETEILNPRVRLPRYLDDARLNRDMDALLARIQASKLRTPALRAAYLDALDAIIADKGTKAIDRAMKTAVQERYRYFANRIAQTELARVQNRQRARELMADKEIEVVRYQMSATHPAPDICDALAHADRYGLGPGLYPKALAPMPPCHPWCRCTCVPVRGIKAGDVSEDPEAIVKYLLTQDPKTAIKIAGSRAKLAAVFTGKSLLDLVNANRPAGYRIGVLGDVEDE
ncbi:MAG: hypothetical protein ACUVR3_10760 [Candidatus Roseilinea sp.]|uniref:hypothetical protein n=1 Tax=Candidatus Roseilinea sp. TaxID=2838777 RepID=UPI00404B55DF